VTTGGGRPTRAARAKPSFAAYLFTACYSAMRPGELDALKWTDLEFTPDAEAIHVQRQ
jgi:hypothetical protein